MIGIQKSADGAARTAQKGLVLSIQALDVGLGGIQPIENLTAERGASIRVSCGAWNWRSSEVCGALTLHALERGVQGMDLLAEGLLLGDAAFESGNVERDDVRARGGKRSSQGIEQGQATFKEFEIVGGFGAHNSGSLVELVFFFFAVQVHIGLKRGARNGAGFHGLAHALLLSAAVFAGRRGFDATCRVGADFRHG